MKKQLTTIVNVILDETGSMSSVKKQTISGFNEYVDTLKKQKGKFLFSLTKFNSNGIKQPYVAVDIKKIEPLTDQNYQPSYNTPLYDACVETIESVYEKAEKMDGPVAVLVVIMTDGEENCSKKHDEKCLSDLIKKLEAKDNWTFVFMGPKLTAWSEAQKLGISQGNVLGWDNTEHGTRSAFASLRGQSVAYAAAMDVAMAAAGPLTSKSFYGGKKDDTQPSQS